MIAAPAWVVLALLLSDQATLRTLDGKAVSGTVDAADSQKLTLKTASGPVTYPLDQILTLDFPQAIKNPPQYQELILVDGTKLRGTQSVVKGETLEWTPLGGPVRAIPLAKVSSLLRAAQDPRFQTDWKDRLGKTRRRDLLAVLVKDRENPEKSNINGLEGTLGQGSPDGKTIGFLPSGGKTELNVPQANLHGLIWLRGTQTDLLAPLGKAELTNGQILELGKIRSVTQGNLGITLACGLDEEIPWDQVSRLDFSRGKLAWLSDLEWEPGAILGLPDRLDRVRRNTNLDGAPIRLKGVVHNRGLALPAPSQVSFALKGEYRELSGLVGVDDGAVLADGGVRLKVEGDGKVLATVEVRPDNRNQIEPLALNLKDIQVLKISVESTDLSPFGKHLILANPKVSR